ncbi:MAG: aminoglycoside 3'-phosphotransferase/choline kinase family protein [Rubrivivax sp.]|nr:aminoglycoside 3'-phosphotransferase/choline kinase family protein [Rubrivivax sp.]
MTTSSGHAAALPANPDPAAFDALHDEPARWRGAVEAIAARHSAAAVEPVAEGTALVAFVGSDLVLKVYPPFLSDHFAFEHAMLQRLHGRLPLPTPRVLARGEEHGWPWLLMTRLAGVPLDRVWPALDEAQRRAVLHRIGGLAAEVHALPVGEIAALAPRWPDFVSRQRLRCAARQQRTGLPAHLLAQLDGFLDGPLPAGPDVLLTGEYTPFNLLHDGRTDGALAGLFDFGDGLVGPAAYDWLGPLCFLAAGDAARVDALFDGYGVRFDRGRRDELLRLLLLHRYSHLPAQLALPGWQDAPDFQTLAARLWP